MVIRIEPHRLGRPQRMRHATASNKREKLRERAITVLFWAAQRIRWRNGRSRPTISTHGAAPASQQAHRQGRRRASRGPSTRGKRSINRRWMSKRLSHASSGNRRNSGEVARAASKAAVPIGRGHQRSVSKALEGYPRRRRSACGHRRAAARRDQTAPKPCVGGGAQRGCAATRRQGRAVAPVISSRTIIAGHPISTGESRK